MPRFPFLRASPYHFRILLAYVSLQCSAAFDLLIKIQKARGLLVCRQVLVVFPHFRRRSARPNSVRSPATSRKVPLLEEGRTPGLTTPNPPLFRGPSNELPPPHRTPQNELVDGNTASENLRMPLSYCFTGSVVP
ncbi:hypothetical protein M413DRAFT_118539 [Hebeloma cylindrosporum]|uniref:Uncharacterized protein n=1 Tax=Hebeloma cylindrosporum TaxID=76867 RepID=A0A0C2Z9R7_HEBCY|nr:hypothetical protein M413DRAFT_118539 [Hebeloma cylindrosporum h7]